MNSTNNTESSFLFSQLASENQIPYFVIGLIATICLLIISFLILFKKTGSSTSKSQDVRKNVNHPTIVLCGPSGAGKTALFNKFTLDEPKTTVTSLEANMANNVTLDNSKKFTLVDYPGHTKLHYKLMSALPTYTDLKGIIFVVDSTVDPKNLTDTAQYLYEILSITEKFSNGIEILLACNKNELFTARPPKKIKDALENEIDKIIKRQKRGLGSVSNGDAEDEDNVSPLLSATFGSNGFNFNGLEGEVSILEGSVLKNKVGKWEEWIDEKL